MGGAGDRGGFGTGKGGPPSGQESGGPPPPSPRASKFTPQREQEAEILTPQSSNVFSFSYDAEASILYVTFKGVTVNPKSVGVGKGAHGGRAQLLGKLGHTITGRTNTRGAQYAYLDVPARVYERMKLAVSKGKFVWDELRIRGTVYGHQYRYMLVQGQAGVAHGHAYIPRKATIRGFQTRSVADQGIGRRGYQSSTLPRSRVKTKTLNRRIAQELDKGFGVHGTHPSSRGVQPRQPRRGR
jgi:hypothetical protein